MKKASLASVGISSSSIYSKYNLMSNVRRKKEEERETEGDVE